MEDIGPIARNLRRSCTESFQFIRIVAIPSCEGVNFVVSPLVIVSSGWCAGGMDVAACRQAHHRRFLAADVMDGDRQGPEDRMGFAIAGTLSRPSRDRDGADPDRRATVLVRRRD